MKVLRKIVMIACFVLYLLGSFFSVSAEDKAADVYVIELHGEVNDAMASYLERELNIAEENNQKAIIDIDTLGGLIISTEEIVNILLTSDVETTAFVSGKAISAGVLITIACENVAMAPSSYIGAAEPVNSSTGEAITSEKTLSFVKGIMSAAAIENGRPEDVVHAMTDKRIVIEGYSQEGQLLSLSSHQAVELGVADVLCSDINEVIGYFKLGQTYKAAPFGLSDSVARALTSTIAMNIFFTLGFVFMILEFFTAGFGVAGVISIVCFALYFGGGFLAGTAEWWAAGLFVLGAIALLIELVIPGFGIFGISGIIMCILGLMFSAESIGQFAWRSAIALIICVILIPVFIKIFGKLKLFDRIANKEEQNVSDGYVINQASDDIIGKEALAVTELRPIGIVEMDSKRMDAFSDEGFIAKGAKVEITGKKSSSVVVRKLREK